MHSDDSNDTMVCSSSSSEAPSKRGDEHPELHANASEIPQLHNCNRAARSDAYRFEVTLCKDKYGLGIYFTEAHGCAIVDLELTFYRLPDDGVAPGEASGVIAPGDELCAINGRSLLGLPFTAVVEALRCIPMGDVTLAFERPMPRLIVVKSDSQRELTCDKSASREPHESNQREHEREESERGSKRWGVFERLSSAAASLTSSSTASSLNSAAMALEIAALEAAVLELEAKLQTADAALEREQKCRFLAEKKNILYRNELLRATEENTALRFQLARQATAQAQRRTFCRDHLHVAI